MMMEKKINLVEILRDCPNGMELDCTVFEGLEFDSIADNEYLPICCRITNPEGGYNIYNFTKYGCWFDADFARCVIFPKGKTTWEGIEAPFKDGDVVSTDDGIFTAIVRRVVECEVEDLFNHDEVYSTYCHIYYEEDDDKAYFVADDTPLRFCRLATEEEKERLFQALKNNGYKWNAETKTLEKLTTNKFDITTLKPFESRVLVRDANGDIWRGAFWGCLLEEREEFKYDTTRGAYAQCIPYEGNEHLIGNTDDCADVYINWH